MKQKSTFLIMLFSLSISFVFGQKILPTDQYGRAIVNSDGKKINYSAAETLLKEVQNTVTLPKPTFSPPQITVDTISENYANLYTIMGDGIGVNAMKAVDIDGDGKLEIFCAANGSAGNAYGSFWYVMNFDRAKNTCETIWASLTLESRIVNLDVFDIGDTQNYKVYMTLQDGTIRIYDAVTKKLDKKAKFSTNGSTQSSVFYADADNDGIKDLVVGSSDFTYILDVKTLTEKFKFKDTGVKVQVGNVDTDAQNEIVSSSGRIYELNGSVLKEEWTFTTDIGAKSLLQLANLDNDSALEIVYCPGWYAINIYDVDTKTTKTTIKTNLDVSAMLITDTNNDGKNELLYGDNQSGGVHCINISNKTELWKIKNTTNGISAIIYADLDNDAKKELVWGGGVNSSAADYLYIFDAVPEKQLWRSEDIRGPFYAITSGDVDGDDKPEIVAVSYESESGYESGVLFIIDGETNKIKWQSPNNFLVKNWDGVYCLQVRDINKDGVNEIIIAADELHVGKIWIINGKTHQIKSEFKFDVENIKAFETMIIDDIDGDGNVEIIASAYNQVCVINPITFTIKLKVQLGNSFYGYNSTLKVADIDGDGKKEIIYNNNGGTIQIINPENKSVWVSTNESFSNFDLLDYNNDGKIDIIGVYNGKIKILDGTTKKVFKTIDVLNNDPIDGIKVFSYNKSNIILFTSKGRIYYYTNENSMTAGQFFGEKIGKGASIQSIVTSNANDILLGTPNSIVRISGKNLDCISLNINETISEVSCNSTKDGKINLNIVGGLPPYDIKWNNNSTLDSLTNLTNGTYSVKIKDKNGCIKEKIFEVDDAYIDAKVTVKNVACSTQFGSASLDIVHGSAPFNFQWSNNNGNNTADNKNLKPGNYVVTVSDAKKCSKKITFLVSKDSLVFTTDVKNISCNGYNNASIYLYNNSSSNAINYIWQDGWNSQYRNQLSAGQYTVTATDVKGCKTTLKFQITEPNKITFKINTSPDNTNTSTWEGKILINGVAGGIAPYTIYWPDLGKYGTLIDGLLADTYNFILTDANNCAINGTATIGNTTADNDTNLEANNIEIFPNPTANKLFLEVKNQGTGYQYSILDLNGKVLQKSMTLNNSSKSIIDLEGFSNGVYILKIEIDNATFYKKFTLQH